MTSDPDEGRTPDDLRDTMIPLHEEELAVSKRQVITGRVRVETVTREHEQLVDTQLARERVEVERIAIGKPIEAIPAVRQDGDTTIIPVVEEVLVVERRLVLKEEIHIHRVRTTEQHQERVTRRRTRTLVKTSHLRSSNMAYQTIVAVFDTAAHAAAAVEALKAGGFAAADISVFDRNRLAGGRGAANLREPGVWRRLFGGNLYQHEAQVYGQAVEEGGVVVSVRVIDSEVAHATGILDLHRPVDVHDRAITSGIAPAAHVETVAAAVAAEPIVAEQRVAVSDKLAEKHDEVLRLAEEQLEVGKRMVETGKTRIRRFVTEREVSADVTLHEEHAEVLRRAVDDRAYVGDIDWADHTIEVVETAEQALVNKTARIVEEVGLRVTGTDHVETVHDKVRRQQVEIERLDASGRPLTPPRG